MEARRQTGAKRPPETRTENRTRLCAGNALLRALAALVFAAALLSFPVPTGAAPPETVARWGRFERVFAAPVPGNPFTDSSLHADFHRGPRTVTVNGFYDGDGVWRIRFMPDESGTWTYTTRSSLAALSGKSGQFLCVAPAPGNHGPVGVSRTYHFAYADGTPYFPVGTTCYAWTDQPETLEEQTLATLKASPFNKVRMCVLPKSGSYPGNEPRLYPFPRDAAGHNDFSRFNPAFFRDLETRVEDLGARGIEADLILFHPYDHWGYAQMPPDADDRYLRYVVARLSAFHNVWWSLANEYDLMKAKTMPDWDRFFRIVQASDPASHLCSIHYSIIMYDQSKPWVTHLSVQSSDFDKAAEWRQQFHKPVIYDECKYEGNIARRWGSLSGQEMARRFWLGAVSGVYAGHGETFQPINNIQWTSNGGALHGDSPPRIAFLRQILDSGPPGGLDPLPDQYYRSAGVEGAYYLYYFDVNQPASYEFQLPPGGQYRADIIDPWAMTITPVPGVFTGRFTLPLPGRPYLAVRLRNVP